MIDKTLYGEAKALSAAELDAVKLFVVDRLKSAQEAFQRGEMGELELIAVTMAASETLGELPLFPGAPQSLTLAVNAVLTESSSKALRERANEIAP